MPSRALLSAAVLVFLAMGIAGSRWISLARFDDPFCYGRGQLWYALDPAACYFSDAVRFFEPVEIETYPHPGLTSTMFAAVATKVMQLGSREDSLRFAVLHQRDLLFVFSSMTTIAFLLCCIPLHAICRRVESAAFADINCALFLASVPVLLFINRFSPEPYMLLFALATVALSLRAMEKPVSVWAWIAMGSCAALAVLAKVLVLPVVLVPLYAALRLRSAKGAVAYAVTGMFVGAALLMKAPMGEVFAAWRGNYLVGTWLDVFERKDQAPFVLSNLILVAMAVTGGWLAIRRRSGVALERVVVLAVLALLMILMIVRRPQWHYFFGFYWILTLFAALAVSDIARARFGAAKASIVAFATVILLVHAWRYPGLYATFKHYHDRYVERRALHPLDFPAVWEKSMGDSDLSEIFPVFSGELQRVLERERHRRP